MIRNNGEMLGFTYNGRTYQFTVKECLTSKDNKSVYSGCFEYDAPPGLEVGTLYCMKCRSIMLYSKHSYEVGGSSSFSYPQHREYLDIMDFSGDHIRSVLAYDDETLALKNRISEDGAQNVRFDSKVIEHLYSTVPFTLMTSEQKLEVIIQVIAGLKELYGTHYCRILDEDITIDAHRDLKFSNVMLEWHSDGTFTVKLIDFATLKTDEKRLADSTSAYPMSPTNTGPEFILGKSVKDRGEYKQFCYSGEKSDVFSLGMMLAELFSVCTYDGVDKNITEVRQTTANPLFLWLSGDSADTSFSCERYRKKYISAIERRATAQDIRNNVSWIEKELEDYGYRFEFPEDIPGMRELFLSATHLVPGERMSLSAFERAVRGMLSHAKKHKKKFSVYMMDASGFDMYKGAYIENALRIFSENYNDEAPYLFMYRGTNTPSGDFPYSYCKPACFRDSESPILISSSSILKGLIEIRKGTPAYTYNGLKFAVSKLISLVDKGVLDSRSFSGNIYIFTPYLPEDKGMTQIEFETDDRHSIFKHLKITVIAAGFAEGAAECLGEYSAVTLSSFGNTDTDAAEALCDKGSFNCSDSGIFIRNADGKIVHISKKK